MASTLPGRPPPAEGGPGHGHGKAHPPNAAPGTAPLRLAKAEASLRLAKAEGSLRLA